MNYLQLLEKRKKAIADKVEKATTVEELRSLSEELTSIDEEIKSLREAKEAETEERQIASMPPKADSTFEEETRSSFNPLATYVQGYNPEQRADLSKKYEQRGQDLKDKRAVTFKIEELPEFRATTIGGGTLVSVVHESPVLNPKFNEVSGLIDRVNAVPLPGGEAYKKGFEVSNGEGDYTTENGNYAEADPVFDYVDINKAKITSYAEISDEAVKLPNVNYQSYVAKAVGESLRKKITKQILVGSGGSNAIRGIFNAPANVIPPSSDIAISEIDENTLDKIIFSFGGDEDIEGGAVLILNKQDLAAFASVRSATGEKVYKIKKDGNSGTISSDDSFEVPFVINSAAPALSSGETEVDTYCMAYGQVKAYEMPIFSDVMVEESRDYKFRSGQTAYRASVFVGGGVAMFKGFIRVKKL